MKKLEKEDFDFIGMSLNQTWNDAHEKLQSKTLGDLERKTYEDIKSKAKKLMDKIDC